MLTLPQLLSFAVIVLMMAAFVWGRLRYDLVAALALLAALAVGVVPLEEAFSGFSDDIVIIVGSALLVSAGVARSGIMEFAIQRYAPDVSSVRAQLAVLVVTVAVLSAFVKNIGALAIMIPIAFQFARRSSTSPSTFLMPMAFASLLGGLMTQIGTSPNIVVSRVREEITGQPFTMFDFTPVGLVLTAAGCIFLVLFYWILPQRTRQDRCARTKRSTSRTTSAEAKVVAESAVAGKTVADLLKIAGGDAVITSIIRSDSLRITPFPTRYCAHGDIAADRGRSRSRSTASSRKRNSASPATATKGAGGETIAIEAVIGENSSLIGWSAQRLAALRPLQRQSACGQPQGRAAGPAARQRSRCRLGDVVVLQGGQARCRNSCAISACCRWPSGRCCSAACAAASCRC